MKVAVNTLFLIPGEVGGSETYLRETLLAVAREHESIDLVLVANQENVSLLRDQFGAFPQCSVHLLPVRAANRYMRIVAEQTRLPWLLRKLKPDLLWSPGYTMPFWAPCRQVVSILDMQYHSHPDDLTRIARWTTHALVTMAARRADRLLTISEFSRREIIKHTGCPVERIAVTHLGVDPAFGSSPQPATRNPQPATCNPQPATCNLQPATRNLQPATRNLQPYILSVANSYPHKNLHQLIDAFARVQDEIPHRLVLVGCPRLGEPQVLRALENVPRERVQRVSGISREALISLYQSADVFVFPSLYEGFGLPVLEAMMAGVPVVTTRAGSIPEVGGDAVVYASGQSAEDLASMIRTVLAWSVKERRVRIEEARRHASQFTWAMTASATVNEFAGIHRRR